MSLIDIIILIIVGSFFVLFFYNYFIKKKGSDCSSCSQVTKYKTNKLKAYYQKVKDQD